MEQNVSVLTPPTPPGPTHAFLSYMNIVIVQLFTETGNNHYHNSYGKCNTGSDISKAL